VLTKLCLPLARLPISPDSLRIVPRPLRSYSHHREQWKPRVHSRLTSLDLPSKSTEPNADAANYSSPENAKTRGIPDVPLEIPMLVGSRIGEHEGFEILPMFDVAVLVSSSGSYPSYEHSQHSPLLSKAHNTLSPATPDEARCHTPVARPRLATVRRC
jgi:hypothetical protein